MPSPLDLTRPVTAAQAQRIREAIADYDKFISRWESQAPFYRSKLASELLPRYKARRADLATMINTEGQA